MIYFQKTWSTIVNIEKTYILIQILMKYNEFYWSIFGWKLYICFINVFFHFVTILQTSGESSKGTNSTSPQKKGRSVRVKSEPMEDVTDGEGQPVPAKQRRANRDTRWNRSGKELKELYSLSLPVSKVF